MTYWKDGVTYWKDGNHYATRGYRERDQLLFKAGVFSVTTYGTRNMRVLTRM